MSFKKKKYEVLREAISKELAEYLFNYFLMKRQVADTMRRERYISPYEQAFGYWEADDNQVPQTYAIYSDPGFDTLLLKMQPLMEKITGLKLYPAYTYSRIYKNGDVLKRHKDRFSCEISTTLNLGGDPWPIYINPNFKQGHVSGPKRGIHQVQDYNMSAAKGVEILLGPGDMLVYRGEQLEHWRESFEGEECGQVFLHYNDRKTPGAESNMFDTRLHLGLPAWFKNTIKK